MVGPVLKVTPNPSYAIDKVSLVVSGLKPNAEFTLYSATTLESGNRFESLCKFVSSNDGVIDVEKCESVGGSYEGVDAMGFLWSMKPSRTNKNANARFIKRDPNQPMIVHISIHEGFVNESLLKEKTPVVCGVVERTYNGGRVHEIVLNEGPVRGFLYVPVGRGKHPGILNLYGAVVGTYRVKPCILAAHNFVVLALTYLGPKIDREGFPDLIELEYFERAVQLLRSHPRVDGSVGIGINCVSTGASIALSMTAFNFSSIRCVAAANGPIYPSIPNFAYKGIKVAERTPFHVADQSRLILHFPSSPFSEEGRRHVIPFFRNRNVAVLYLACTGDNVLDTKTISNHVNEIKTITNRPDINVIEYEEAGHLLEIPYMPLTDKCYFPLLQDMVEFGGSPKKHMQAQVKSWNDLVNFFKKELNSRHHGKL